MEFTRITKPRLRGLMLVALVVGPAAHAQVGVELSDRAQALYQDVQYTVGMQSNLGRATYCLSTFAQSLAACEVGGMPVAIPVGVCDAYTGGSQYSAQPCGSTALQALNVGYAVLDAINNEGQAYETILRHYEPVSYAIQRVGEVYNGAVQPVPPAPYPPYNPYPPQPPIVVVPPQPYPPAPPVVVVPPRPFPPRPFPPRPFPPRPPVVMPPRPFPPRPPVVMPPRPMPPRPPVVMPPRPMPPRPPHHPGFPGGRPPGFPGGHPGIPGRPPVVVPPARPVGPRPPIAHPVPPSMPRPPVVMPPARPVGPRPPIAHPVPPSMPRPPGMGGPAVGPRPGFPGGGGGGMRPGNPGGGRPGFPGRPGGRP